MNRMIMKGLARWDGRVPESQDARPVSLLDSGGLDSDGRDGAGLDAAGA